MLGGWGYIQQNPSKWDFITAGGGGGVYNETLLNETLLQLGGGGVYSETLLNGTLFQLGGWGCIQ